MNLNKKHKGSTIINISDNIVLKLVNIDFRKRPNDPTGKFIYSWYKSYIGYNVEIFTKTKKQKKKFRNGYVEDSVGKGHVKDLIEIKNKLYEISLCLENNEFLIIEGADERRAKIYMHFLFKDKRIAKKMFGDSDNILYIFNDTGVPVWNYMAVFEGYDNDGSDIINKKMLKQRVKEWEEMIK